MMMHRLNSDEETKPMSRLLSPNGGNVSRKLNDSNDLDASTELADVASGDIGFDLENTPLAIRPKTWVNRLNEFFYDYHFHLPDDFMMGRFQGGNIGDLKIASITSDAMSVFRTNAHIARDPLDSYFVLLPKQHKISLTQRGNAAIVGDNQFALVSTTQPYTYIQDETTQFNNLIIPGKYLRQFAPGADDAVAVASNQGLMNKIFTDFANSLCMGIKETDVQARATLGRQVVELLGLVLDGADYKSSATPIMLAHRRRILKLIEMRFTDPKFDLDEISKTLKLSRRHIQDIFASSGETVTDVIKSRRLKEACRLLNLRESNRYTISQIAYSVGFVSLAHFSRVFKEMFGCSPSHYCA